MLLAANADSIFEELGEKGAKAAKKRHQAALDDEREASQQTQHVLTRIGRALGYDVFVARNDAAAPPVATALPPSRFPCYIYSGILRMKDLAMSVPDQQCHFYLVAPEVRE